MSPLFARPDARRLLLLPMAGAALSNDEHRPSSSAVPDLPCGRAPLSPALREVVAGAAAGVTGTLFGFPLDTVKSRLQTGAGGSAARTALHLLRTEGLLGFYKGVPAPLVSLVILNGAPTAVSRVRNGARRRAPPAPAPARSAAPTQHSAHATDGEPHSENPVCSFSAYAHTRTLVGLPPRGEAAPDGGAGAGAGAAGAARPWGPPGSTPAALQVFAAGALCSPPVTLVATPFELVKVQCQVDSRGAGGGGGGATAAPRYRGAAHAAASIVAVHGPGALLRGAAVNGAREAVFLGTYFCVYEGVRDALAPPQLAPSSPSPPSSLPQPLLPALPPGLATPLAGAAAGVLGWAVSFPLDTVKSGVQGAALGGPRLRARDVVSRLAASPGGLRRALYRGLGPTLLRAAVVSSSRFTAYEAAMAAMDGGR